MSSLDCRGNRALRVLFYKGTKLHWRRKWQPAPLFLPGESQGWGSLVDSSMGSHRVGHDWSDLAAAAAAASSFIKVLFHDLITSQGPHLMMPLHGGWGFNIFISRRHIQSTAVIKDHTRCRRIWKLESKLEFELRHYVSRVLCFCA